jgi:hypothetical protein
MRVSRCVCVCVVAWHVLLQAADQRRAFWRLQEKLQHGDERAQRTYAEVGGTTICCMHCRLMPCTLPQPAHYIYAVHNC